MNLTKIFELLLVVMAGSTLVLKALVLADLVRRDHVLVQDHAPLVVRLLLLRRFVVASVFITIVTAFAADGLVYFLSPLPQLPETAYPLGIYPAIVVSVSGLVVVLACLGYTIFDLVLSRITDAEAIKYFQRGDFLWQSNQK